MALCFLVPVPIIGVNVPDLGTSLTPLIEARTLQSQNTLKTPSFLILH